MLGTKFAFKGIALIIKLLFKYSWLWITLIMLSVVMVGSIKEGIEQGDLKIPLRDAGLFIASADEKVYDKVQDLEFDMPKSKSFINKTLGFLDFGWYILKNLFAHLWMILFNFILFYKFFLWILGDISKRRRAVLVSILTMVFLQIMVSGIPFRGIYSLGKLVTGVIVSI